LSPGALQFLVVSRRATPVSHREDILVRDLDLAILGSPRHARGRLSRQERTARLLIPLEKGANFFYPQIMTAKEEALALIERLPANVSLDEITDELLRVCDSHSHLSRETPEERAEILGAIRKGRESILAGRVKTHDDVVEIVKSWSGKWNSK
jgi:hypothetical protein